jgi:hypothetical protein
VMLKAQKKIQSAAISQSRFVSILSIGELDGLGLARTRRGSPARLRTRPKVLSGFALRSKGLSYYEGLGGPLVGAKQPVTEEAPTLLAQNVSLLFASGN